MHSVYFVVIPKEETETSMGARENAYDLLEAENFAGDGGYFGGGKSDWYVVGGRWSGLLTSISKEWNDLVLPEIKRIKEKYDLEHILGVHYSDEAKQANVEKAVAEADAFAMKTVGLPYNRNTYDSLGFEDDAKVITEELIESLETWLKMPDDPQELRGVELFSQSNGEEMVDKDTLKAYLGDWLVVIDYHM